MLSILGISILSLGLGLVLMVQTLFKYNIHLLILLTGKELVLFLVFGPFLEVFQSVNPVALPENSNIH